MPISLPNPIETSPTIARSQQFQTLAERWKRETRFFGSVEDKVLHPSYQRIIGMGAVAVPMILDDLDLNGPADWFWALTAITGENPITEDMAGNMNSMTEAWLRWGKANDLASDSR